jgi:hypothetical protein
MLVASVYLSRSEFMPYHAEAMRMAWSDVPANVRLLFLAMIHMIGVLAIATGGALAVMLIRPFRRGELWAAWTIPVILLAIQAGTLFVTLHIAVKTGAHTPWLAAIGGWCITVAGAVLSALARRRTVIRTQASAA